MEDEAIDAIVLVAAGFSSVEQTTAMNFDTTSERVDGKAGEGERSRRERRATTASEASVVSREYRVADAKRFWKKKDANFGDMLCLFQYRSAKASLYTSSTLKHNRIHKLKETLILDVCRVSRST